MFTHDTGNVILNLITCGEMVVCAVAQSYSFSYKDFTDEPISPLVKNHMIPKRKNHNLCNTVWKILFSTREVLDDAQRTFIKENDAEDSLRETQLDELMKAKSAAFNWSDEELLGEMDEHIRQEIIIKEKYAKKSKQSAYSSIISRVPRFGQQQDRK